MWVTPSGKKGNCICGIVFHQIGSGVGLRRQRRGLDLVSLQNPAVKGSRSCEIYQVAVLAIDTHEVFMSLHRLWHHTRSGYLELLP